MKYQITAKEEGRGRGSVTRFATIEAASQYIRDRWQGAEYCDGSAAFHTDYCAYTLKGFTLEDVGTFGFEGEDRTFTFKADARPKPTCARACKDDSCDGAHCRTCGGHFLDFYNLRLRECSACQVERECAQGHAEDRCFRSDGFDPRAPFPHASDPHWSSPEADFAHW